MHRAKANIKTGSSSKHTHSHDHTLPLRNPHAKLDPAERLSRLMLFLEAQFGADNVSPVSEPKIPPLSPPIRPRKHKKSIPPPADGAKADPSSEGEPKTEDSVPKDKEPSESEYDTDEEALDLARRTEEAKARELTRLHKLGIPVPGVRIKIAEKMQAVVWLETLEVESENKVFKERVRAVVERAVECVAPLW